MRPSLSLLFNQRLFLLLTTFLVFSALLSTAAVARGGGQPSAFYTQQQQQQEQQQQQGHKAQQVPLTESTPDHKDGPKQHSIPPTTPTKTPIAPSSLPTQPAPPDLFIPPSHSPSSSSYSPSHSPSSSSYSPSHSPSSSSHSPSHSPSSPPPPSPTPTAATAATTPHIPEYKYFHEAGYTYELAHYDERFFRAAVPYETHRAVLSHLVRAYLTTFASLHLETWLAHGTLLGWWWNGLTLPWDYDLDAQVSGATMRALADRHNGSLHEYRYVDGVTGREETRVYLLDVNPFATDADRGTGENVIDARWIDVGTGMFVDITALMERDPRDQPGVVSCKNFHGYTGQQLYPLRETEFEGVQALVPWEYEGILVEEYGEKSLVTTEWEGHVWKPEIKEWVKKNETEIEAAL